MFIAFEDLELANHRFRARQLEVLDDLLGRPEKPHAVRNHRAAERPAELQALERLLAQAAVLRLREVVDRDQRFVAAEQEPGAAELVGARLAGEHDDRRAAAVLGLEAGAERAELFDAVEAELHRACRRPGLPCCRRRPRTCCSCVRCCRRTRRSPRHARATRRPPLPARLAGASSSPARLRFTIGICATSVWRIVDETSACVVSTSGSEPWTVRFS